MILGFGDFDIMENNIFNVFFIMFSYTLMPHNIILINFRLPYFHVLISALFLHSILVFSFYIYVVLTLSIGSLMSNDG